MNSSTHDVLRTGEVSSELSIAVSQILIQGMAMRHRKHRSFGEAVERLDAVIAACARGEKLPPVRALCKQHGLSPSTVQKALRVLQQRGRCVVVPRGGVLVAEGGAPVVPISKVASGPEVSYERLRSWQYVKRLVSDDLYSGRFGAGERLPSAKELRTRFGVGHAALFRSLAQLGREGRLQRDGRGWRVTTVGASPSGSMLVFVGHGETLSDLYEYTPRSAEYFRTMERLCQQHGLRTEFVSFRDAVLWRGRGPEFLAPESGLTSYNFNAGLVARRMLEHVLGGPLRPPSRAPEWVEVPGFVVERATSGPVRNPMG